MYKNRAKDWNKERNTGVDELRFQNRVSTDTINQR